MTAKVNVVVVVAAAAAVALQNIHCCNTPVMEEAEDNRL